MTELTTFLKQNKVLLLCTPFGISPDCMFSYIKDYVSSDDINLIYWNKTMKSVNLDSFVFKLQKSNQQTLIVISIECVVFLLNFVESSPLIVWSSFNDFNFSINIKMFDVDEFLTHLILTKDKTQFFEHNISNHVLNNDIFILNDLKIEDENAEIYNLFNPQNFEQNLYVACSNNNSHTLICYYDKNNKIEWEKIVKNWNFLIGLYKSFKTNAFSLEQDKNNDLLVV